MIPAYLVTDTRRDNHAAIHHHCRSMSSQFSAGANSGRLSCATTPHAAFSAALQRAHGDPRLAYIQRTKAALQVPTTCAPATIPPMFSAVELGVSFSYPSTSHPSLRMHLQPHGSDSTLHSNLIQSTAPPSVCPSRLRTYFVFV